MLNVLNRFFGEECHPENKVLEIRSESLCLKHIIARDDAMVVYAPPRDSNLRDSIYEIVLQRPHTDSNITSFSLFRTSSNYLIMEKFDTFANRLPLFVKLDKEFYNVQGLQKVCDILTAYPSWSIAHLVVFFNKVEYVSDPKVLQFINYEEYKLDMSPFQLAIKKGHLEMVKALLPLCKIDHLDNEGNSVFHYAAATNKYILQLLIDKTTVHLNHFNADGYTPLHLACLTDKPECVNVLLMAGANVNLSAKQSKPSKTSTPTSLAGFVKNNKHNKLYNQYMKYGGTPLHWCSSRETLNALIAQGCDVNAVNFEGKTALHVMIARNCFECVVSLLAHDAYIDVCDKDGNAPIHIAIEHDLVSVVQCLVVFGCDVNIKNAAGETPRHLVGNVGKGEKAEILYILHSVGAKRCESTSCPGGCNPNDTYNGIPRERPEHVEQREHIESMLATTSRQMSEVLEAIGNGNLDQADAPSIVDTEREKNGQTTMDALLSMFTFKVKAEENKQTQAVSSGSGGDTTSSVINTPASIGSPTSILSFFSGTQKQKQSSGIDGNNGQAKELCNETPYGRGRVLCLDGGGVRGLIIVQMLLEIEKITETPIVHLFDWIAGTSTGGIIALALGCGKSLRQCMGIYFLMKEQCFVGSRPYSSEKFETILKDNLGEYTVMTDIKHPKIMITGVMADRKPVDLHLFRNYKCASEILGFVTPISNRRTPPPSPENQLVWRAARATGAAPSYFRAFGTFLDGGLIANNPTLDAMTEIHEYNMALRSVGCDNKAIPEIVVSLGTGLFPVTELKDIDLYRPERIWDTAKAASCFLTIFNLLIDQATASDGRVVDRARAWCSTLGVPYFRFNPQLQEDIAIDEKDDQKLINMLWCAKVHMHSNRQKILDMINYLK